MGNTKYISTTICLLFTINLCLASGWPQPKGKAYLKLSQWWVISDRHYTDVGKIDPNATYGVFNTSLYAEYGFTDRLTGLVYFPFYSRAYFNNSISATTGETLTKGEAINSIGDTNLGIKYGLTSDKAVALSTTLTFGLPVGNDSGGSANNLQTGDGEFNQMLQVDAGMSFSIGNSPGYANAYIGYNNRTNGFSDEFRFGIEAGITILNKKVTTTARLYGIQSTENGTLSNQINNTSIFANNSEHLTFAPEVAYHINDQWGISAGLGTALSGKIIFAAPSYEVGVFLRL